MSKYTTQLRYLIDMKYDIGLNDYPIFDENYREILNNKIINHYYTEEIGFETARLFKIHFTARMNEIMPKYNILYQAQNKLVANIDTLYNNVNLTETLKRNIKGDSESATTGTSSSSSTGKGVNQDTPQGSIKNSTIENYEYASEINLSKDNTSANSNVTGNVTQNSTEDYVKTIVGNNGQRYVVDVYKDIINNIMNIDQKIISELDDLFMGIW